MSNNGMHPTADTPALIYLESLGAAGDAGRYASTFYPRRKEELSGGFNLIPR
jgi:hypothetical protein